MPKSHDQLSEKTSESGIVAALAASPLYRDRPATAFDLATTLDAEELAAFIQSTQPKEWAKLAKQFPGAEREMLAAQVSALVAKRGTLEVLRNGASFNGINLQLAFFKPSAGGNPEHQARYAGNRFAIIRQIHFSTKTPDQSVDMGILLNGLPIVSIELKNHFTGQNVQHAIAQYRRRDPREAFFARCAGGVQRHGDDQRAEIHRGNHEPARHGRHRRGVQESGAAATGGGEQIPDRL